MESAAFSNPLDLIGSSGLPALTVPQYLQNLGVACVPLPEVLACRGFSDRPYPFPFRRVAGAGFALRAGSSYTAIIADHRAAIAGCDRCGARGARRSVAFGKAVSGCAGLLQGSAGKESAVGDSAEQDRNHRIDDAALPRCEEV